MITKVASASKGGGGRGGGAARLCPKERVNCKDLTKREGHLQGSAEKQRGGMQGTVPVSNHDRVI